MFRPDLHAAFELGLCSGCLELVARRRAEQGPGEAEEPTAYASGIPAHLNSLLEHVNGAVYVELKSLLSSFTRSRDAGEDEAVLLSGRIRRMTRRLLRDDRQHHRLLLELGHLLAALLVEAEMPSDRDLWWMMEDVEVHADVLREKGVLPEVDLLEMLNFGESVEFHLHVGGDVGLEEAVRRAVNWVWLHLDGTLLDTHDTRRSSTSSTEWSGRSSFTATRSTSTSSRPVACSSWSCS